MVIANTSSLISPSRQRRRRLLCLSPLSLVNTMPAADDCLPKFYCIITASFSCRNISSIFSKYIHSRRHMSYATSYFHTGNSFWHLVSLPEAMPRELRVKSLSRWLVITIGATFLYGSATSILIYSRFHYLAFRAGLQYHCLFILWFTAPILADIDDNIAYADMLPFRWIVLAPQRRQ